MNLFFIAAVVLAAWAVVLMFLGLRHPGFPGNEGGARVVAAISFVLAGVAIATAVISGHEEELTRQAEARAEQAPPPQPTSDGDRPPLELEVDSTGQLRFEQDELVTTAGPTTIELKNSAPLDHNVGIVGQGVDVVGPTVGPGGRSRVSASLQPGRYTFYCSVLGHREGGMEGTLVVR